MLRWLVAGALMSDATSSFAPPTVRIFTRQDDSPMLANVTSKYTQLVRSHLVGVRRALANARGDDDRFSLMIPYLADEYLLGHGSAGLQEYHRQAGRGRLGKDARRARVWLLKLLKLRGYR
jgi:hypothetical protein